jgi:hypothetical protein
MKAWRAARSWGGKGVSDASVSDAVQPNSGVHRAMERAEATILDSISDIREAKLRVDIVWILVVQYALSLSKNLNPFSTIVYFETKKF